jgi:hypothetical protein
MKPTEWMVHDTASNDTATATKAAAADKRHTLSSVHASFDTSTVSKNLTITVTLDGTSTASVHVVHGADVIPLEIRGDINSAVSAALEAGGSSVDGFVTILGHTTG